jgi:hypothetical protein
MARDLGKKITMLENNNVDFKEEFLFEFFADINDWDQISCHVIIKKAVYFVSLNF